MDHDPGPQPCLGLRIADRVILSRILAGTWKVDGENGEIISRNTGKPLKFSPQNNGYLSTIVNYKGHKVAVTKHRVVYIGGSCKTMDDLPFDLNLHIDPYQREYRRLPARKSPADPLLGQQQPAFRAETPYLHGRSGGRDPTTIRIRRAPAFSRCGVQGQPGHDPEDRFPADLCGGGPVSASEPGTEYLRRIKFSCPTCLTSVADKFCVEYRQDLKHAIMNCPVCESPTLRIDSPDDDI